MGYAFEITVSNSVRNQVQNIPGYYGTGTGSTFAGAVCNAGTLCIRNGLVPSLGYESTTPSILNGNTWYMNSASDGTSGLLGDHTGIYACNTYDVNKAVSGDNQWNLGAKTLGLSIAAGTRGDFTEIIVNEQYTFGADNFTATPGTDAVYCTIANGKLTASSTVPTAGTGLYFKILRTKNFTEGTTFGGVGYVCQALRTKEAETK